MIKDKEFLLPFLLGGICMMILMFVVPAIGRHSSKSTDTPITIDFNDNTDAWSSVVKQADRFVYGQCKADGSEVIMFLYDENREYLCEAHMDIEDMYVDIKRGRYNTIAPWYENQEKSRKMFILLYQKLPQDVKDKCPSNQTIIKKINNL